MICSMECPRSSKPTNNVRIPSEKPKIANPTHIRRTDPLT
jgi:hypothetical protein